MQRTKQRVQSLPHVSCEPSSTIRASMDFPINKITWMLKLMKQRININKFFQVFKCSSSIAAADHDDETSFNIDRASLR